MVGTSKILTVSYGTFSCTLEGFDEPFSTMKAIAEYFRDLASQDRYFGAEPPTPDAEMLHRIAEQAISNRVDARVSDNSVTLRAHPAAASAQDGSYEDNYDETGDAGLDVDALLSAGQGEPLITAAQALADETSDETSHVGKPAARKPRAAKPVAEPELPESVTNYDEEETSSSVIPISTGLESVAAKLARIRAAVAQDDNAPVGQNTPRDAVAFFSRPAVIAPTETEDEGETEAEAERQAAETARLAAEQEAARLTAQREAEAQVEAEAQAKQEALAEAAALAEEKAEAARVAAEAEREAELEAIRREEAAEAERLEAKRLEAKRLEAKRKAEATRVAAEQEAQREEEQRVAAEAAQIEVATIEAAETVEAVTQATEEADAEQGPAEVEEPVTAESDAPESDATQSDATEIDSISAITDASEVDTTDATAVQYEGTLPEETKVEDASKPFILGADSAVKPSVEEDEDAAFAAGLAAALAGDRDDANVDDTADAAETATQDTAPRRVRVLRVKRDSGSTVRDGDNVVASASRGQALDRAPSTPDQDHTSGREALTGAEGRDDAAVARILAATDDRLQGVDTRRRLDSISHLKAAVAATRAEMSGGARKDSADAARPYREDLADVVGATPKAETRSKRPAPLVLVSEQRVDNPSEHSRELLERRRISTGDRSSHRDTAALAEAKSFGDYAEEVGATDLPELLEAAAAYVSFVEGSPHFSRPQIMGHVERARGDTDYSREDGLRTFGTLLRNGTIRKLKRGRFAISEDSRFIPEDERAAG